MMGKLIFTASAALLAFMPISVLAAPPNPADEQLGMACKTPPKGSGLVAGYFRGWQQTPFQDWGSGLMPVERFRCFKTMTQCKRWLYTMNYYYNEKTPDAHMCTRF